MTSLVVRYVWSVDGKLGHRPILVQGSGMDIRTLQVSLTSMPITLHDDTDGLAMPFAVYDMRQAKAEKRADEVDDLIAVCTVSVLGEQRLERRDSFLEIEELMQKESTRSAGAQVALIEQVHCTDTDDAPLMNAALAKFACTLDAVGVRVQSWWPVRKDHSLWSMQFAPTGLMEAAAHALVVRYLLCAAMDTGELTLGAPRVRVSTEASRSADGKAIEAINAMLDRMRTNHADLMKVLDPKTGGGVPFAVSQSLMAAVRVPFETALTGRGALEDARYAHTSNPTEDVVSALANMVRTTLSAPAPAPAPAPAVEDSAEEEKSAGTVARAGAGAGV